MNSGDEEHGQAGASMRLRRPSPEIVYGILTLAIVAYMAHFVQGMLGVRGLALMTAAGLAAILVFTLAMRYPVVIPMIWFLSMSGIGTIGMIRMPGIPDFSFPRMFLIFVIIMLPLGVLGGRALFRPPYLPDVMLVLHTAYVLFNLNVIGDGTHFHTWYNSSLSPLFGYFFAKQYITSERNLKAMMVFIVLMGAYFSITSIAEHFGIRGLIWPKYILDPNIGKVWMGRSRGPFLQPGVFGEIMGMYLLFYLFMLTRRVGRGWRIVLAIGLAAAAIGVFFTYTRGCWLATVAGVVALAVLRPTFRKIVIAAGVVGVLLATVGLVNTANDEFLQERLDNTSTIENRLGFMATAARMVQEKPLFGVGYFKYLELSSLYNQGTHIPFYGYIKRKQGADVAIHDIYLGRAAEEGMVSIILYFGFFAAAGVMFLRRWRENPSGEWFNRDLIALFAAVVIAYLVGGIAFDYRYFDLLNIIPMFMIGVVAGFPGDTRDLPAATDPRGAPSSVRPLVVE